MTHRNAGAALAIVVLTVSALTAPRRRTGRFARMERPVILHPDGRWEIALAPPAAAAAAAARALTTANVFFGNLHSHTSYSDGSGTPTDAYLHARDVAGLDFLAITEHNHKNSTERYRHGSQPLQRLPATLR